MNQFWLGVALEIVLLIMTIGLFRRPHMSGQFTCRCGKQIGFSSDQLNAVCGNCFIKHRIGWF